MQTNCWLKQNCNQIDCDKDFCLKKFKLDNLYNEALIPLNLRYPIKLRYDSDGTDKREFEFLNNIKNNILSFVDSGSNLFLHSNTTGCGKTSWSLKLIAAYLDNIWVKSELGCKVLFISVPRFLLALKNNLNEKDEYAQHILDNVNSASLVIWDDIATKSVTVFEAENLLSIIDTRLSLGKSNIYTSNLNSEEIHQYLGDRLYSRIVQSSIDVELKGSDKRSLTKERKI